MNEHVAGHAAGLFPVPGEGVLARRGDLILLCSLEDSQAADDLLDLLEQVAGQGGDGRRFAGAVADVLEAASRGPSVLAFGPSGQGLAVTVSGGAWADLTTADGTARIEAGHPRMLVRATMRVAVSGVRGGLSPGDTGAASTDRFSRLDAGTVRAGGLSYYSDGLATGRQAGHGGARPAGSDVSGGQMSASDISGAQTSAMEIPRARGRGSGSAAAAAAAAEDPAEEPDAAPLDQAGEGPAEPEVGLPAEPEVEPPLQQPSVPEPSAGLFAPTEAWAPPPESSAAQERQATELWSGPSSNEQAQEEQVADEAAPPAAATPGGAGPGTAEDFEREVTELPEPYAPVSGFDQASGQPFEAVVLLDAGSGAGVEVPAREPLSKVKDMPPGSASYVSVGPIIQGVYCKNGHFDDPEALFCAICGISMNQQTLVPRPGERPPLGVLLLDDGSVFQLDSDYVVGREPSLDGSVAAGKARPLRVTDESGIVSRVHARVHLDGWRVLVTDLGSANGTRVLLPGQPADQPLVPQVPIVLGTGSQVDLGGRGFRYESHRGR
jgi:FHA domain